MFSWFKKTPAPEISPANPGKSVEVSVSFSRADKTWTENVDVVSSFSSVLATAGHPHKAKKSWIELDSGFIVQPRLVSLNPLDNGGVRSTTTVEISHPKIVPVSVFEYQHSTGDNLEQSVAKGFSGWMNLDLPVFLDALRREPKDCTFLQMELPASETAPKRKRRVILGPVSYYAALPPDTTEEHPFCPCCLFTKSIEPMKPIVNDRRFHAIRLFGMRAADGTPSADCRVNGEDLAEGQRALLEYIKTWPNRGVEFRKQYVVVHDDPTT